MSLIFFEPVFQEKIWGGQALHDQFGYTLPSNNIGEDWAISAHPNGISTVANGRYKGTKLTELWENHQELFGYQSQTVFPLLVKILDAQDDLSVQVHPNDQYALEHEGELGKTECWYVIDAQEGAQIVYGHQATTHDEFEAMVENGEWDALLTSVPVEKGDFFYVPAGTVHAIGKGILILETQQSSDTTYRLYDYDRVDDSGNPRPLHIQQSLDVTSIPFKAPVESGKPVETPPVSELVDNDFFTVWKWAISQKQIIPLVGDYTLATVIEGEGKVFVEDQEDDVYTLTKGDSFIVPHGISTLTLSGDCTLITSIAKSTV